MFQFPSRLLIRGDATNVTSGEIQSASAPETENKEGQREEAKEEMEEEEASPCSGGGGNDDLTGERQPQRKLQNGAAVTENKASDAKSSDQIQDDSKDDDDVDTTKETPPPIKLYQSSRLKGYITVILAAGINFNSVQRSELSNQPKVVPSTPGQRQYGLAVCTIDMVLATFAVLCHLDRITPLKQIWIKIFQPKSRIELILALFLTVWNTVAMGVETSVGGIAGDGKGQYNIYFSIWILCLTSFWILERWWVDCGWSSFRSFITSWPYRAPAWICITILTLSVMIWSVDLWQNYPKLDPEYASAALEIFNQVPQGQWQWYVTLTVFTLCPAVAFVAIELFRDTNDDGSTQEKTKLENVVEGVIFLLLVLAWIPTVGAVTTPNGAASLVGNSYFFTWLLVVFLFEGLIWWIHDYRFEIHEALRAKEREYRRHQREVLAKTKQLQRDHERAEQEESDSSDEDQNIVASEPLTVTTTNGVIQGRDRMSSGTEYYDTSEA